MQPLYELTIHPVNLTRHGLTPSGQPLYRVVWADSRKTKLSLLGKIIIRQRYQHGDEAHCAGHWILERWAPPEVILGMTRVQWEDFLASMPLAPREEYPVGGDYEFTGHIFPAQVDEAFVHLLIAHHQWKMRNTTTAERQIEMVQAEDRKEKQSDEKFDALYSEAREETLLQ